MDNNDRETILRLFRNSRKVYSIQNIVDYFCNKYTPSQIRAVINQEIDDAIEHDLRISSLKAECSMQSKRNRY